MTKDMIKQYLEHHFESDSAKTLMPNPKTRR